MFFRRCFAVVGLGLLGLSMLGLFSERADGQKIMRRPPIQPDPQPVGNGSASGHSSVKLIEDSNYRRVIEVGRDCIKDEEWRQAVQALQSILKEKKDSYVQIRDQDPLDPRKETARWTSVKFEANNLLGSMKLEGLQVYENEYGADAKVLLDDAKKNGDREKLAEVAQRYCHTTAGIEANEILATLFLARGQVFTAALRFEKLLQMNPKRTNLSDLTLYKATLAFQRAGDKKNADETWKRLSDSLQANNKVGLKIGDEMVPIAKLKAVLDEIPKVDDVNVHDWPSVRGNYTNTGQAVGSPPLLDTVLWKRPLFKDKLDGFNDEDPDDLALARVEAAIKQVVDANQAVLPGSYPIASQGIMVYRSYRDIRAVALKEIKIKDEESGQVTTIKPGELIWKSIPMNRSLAVLLEKNATRAKAEQYLDSYKQVAGFSSFLYDNTLNGTLVTDSRYVYAINDLSVPPHPGAFYQNQFNPQMNQWQAGEMKPLMVQNELYAYDLLTGKLKWDLNHDDPQFKDSHFLSLPISVGGKLYVLNEKLELGGAMQPNPFGGGVMNPFPGESELRLVCIDPTKLVQVNSNVKPTIVEPIQVLGNVAQHNRHLQDIGRRVNAIQLAYGEGILVCPTNAGEVFGIDLMTRSLVWSYPYRENPHQQIVLPGMQIQPQPGKGNQTTTIVSKWKSAPPAIQDGKIVFTAPDADSIHCVSLRDGKPLWRKAQSKGDLYMAGVFQGRVLIVGESNVRILDLKNGSQVGSVPTGDLPSGQGVASKGIYYLPLKKGEILAIDIAKGEIKAHNRAAGAGGAAPGNLVFYEGMVLSQTPTEVMAYPQLSVRLDSAKRDSAGDPENMTKMTDYGELLLKDGQVQIAVKMLLKVHERKPADPLGKRVRERLFEGLTDLMQVDFNDASKDYLTVYQDLCAVPGNDAEEQARKAKYFRLVGQGREAQGKLVEAFQMYKEFGALKIHSKDGIASPEDPSHKIPVNVWLRGRISGMLAKAPEKEKKPLDDKIAEEWTIVDSQKDIDKIRSFVGMFDVPVRVGREARIKLAQSIMERNERANFLEAELLLYQVMGSEFRADPATGGRALAALAKLEETKATGDSMRLAAAYYRELGRDFAKDAVRGKQTGADLLNELASDKRFLPYLAEASGSWGNVKLAARELDAGSFPVGVTGFVLTPQGDQTPFARMNRVMLDPSDTTNPKVRLRDIGANQDVWTTNLGHVQMNQQLFFHLYQQANNSEYFPNARFRFFHVKGHLIVCQVGIMVYCLDGDTGKKLWEMQTVENIPQNGLVHLQQVVNDREGSPELYYWNQQTNQRFTVTMGRVGTAQASYVAVLGHKGLTVHDPLRGTIMWKKPDIENNTHVFGDDQYVFLVDANGNGVGRTIRASDGETLQVPDFSAAYQSRVKLLGRKILSAHDDRAKLTVRLYDIVTGKDVWSKVFPTGSRIMQTEDKNLTGVVSPNGDVKVLEVANGNELLASTIVQGRINAQDLVGLQDLLLLQDSERFYIALNKPIDRNKVVNAQLRNNFNNGTRCLPVNGWFLALNRQAGAKKIGEREITWKKGDLAWHSYSPVANQMIVMEQFDQLPVILFTAQHNELANNGGNNWWSVTQSLSKQNGKMIYDSGKRQTNGVSPMFTSLQLDLKSRTINLIGFGKPVQHYVDDGKGPPPNPQGAMLNPGDLRDGTSNTILLGGGQQGVDRLIRQPRLDPLAPEPPVIVERILTK